MPSVCETRHRQPEPARGAVSRAFRPGRRPSASCRAPASGRDRRPSAAAVSNRHSRSTIGTSRQECWKRAGDPTCPRRGPAPASPSRLRRRRAEVGRRTRGGRRSTGAGMPRTRDRRCRTVRAPARGSRPRRPRSSASACVEPIRRVGRRAGPRCCCRAARQSTGATATPEPFDDDLAPAEPPGVRGVGELDVRAGDAAGAARSALEDAHEAQRRQPADARAELDARQPSASAPSTSRRWRACRSSVSARAGRARGRPSSSASRDLAILVRVESPAAPGRPGSRPGR